MAFAGSMAHQGVHRVVVPHFYTQIVGLSSDLLGVALRHTANCLYTGQPGRDQIHGQGRNPASYHITHLSFASVNGTGHEQLTRVSLEISRPEPNYAKKQLPVC